MSRPLLAAAVLVALLAAAAKSGVAAARSASGNTMELYRWALEPGALSTRSKKAACIATAFSSGLRDAKLFSQHGEDGILEAMFKCIGAGRKYYVEFGTESGVQCESRA
jgi:hypothetical protein